MEAPTSCGPLGLDSVTRLRGIVVPQMLYSFGNAAQPRVPAPKHLQQPWRLLTNVVEE